MSLTKKLQKCFQTIKLRLFVFNRRFMLLNSLFYVNFSIISLVKSISTFVKLGKLRDRLVSMLEIVHSPLLMNVKLEKRIR